MQGAYVELLPCLIAEMHGGALHNMQLPAEADRGWQPRGHRCEAKPSYFIFKAEGGV